MSMVNADSVQLFAMLKKMQDSISSIETTKKSVKMKYEQLGAGWQDKKYNELETVFALFKERNKDFFTFE